MKKKIVNRSLLGAILGLSISSLITIFISLAINDGNFHPVVPRLISDCGSEMNAVLLQTAFSFFYGAVWAGSSVIWEMEKWSILRQTMTHLVIVSLATLPTAYYTRWMEHSVYGVLGYYGMFLGIYLAIWFSQYFYIKKRIQQINERVKENSPEN